VIHAALEDEFQEQDGAELTAKDAGPPAAGRVALVGVTV
jgi:hypothetical protein